MEATQQTDSPAAESTAQVNLHAAAIAALDKGFAISPALPRSKKPATAHGHLDASRDRAQIDAWWAATPDANIIIACGGSNLIVLDFDHGEPPADLPATYTVRSGSGRGVHMYYRGTTRDTKMYDTAGNLLGEVKSQGGYVIGAASVHESGGVYTEVNSLPIAEVPREQIERLTRKQTPVAGVRDEHGLIAHGFIHDHLVKQAGILRQQGYPVEAVEDALSAWAHENCAPPLDEAKIRQVARSSGNWEQGDPSKPKVTIGGREVGLTPAKPEDLTEPCDDECSECSLWPQETVERLLDSGKSVKEIIAFFSDQNSCHYTELGNSQRFTAKFKQDVRFSHGEKSWYLWNGHIWRCDRTGAVNNLMKTIAVDIFQEAVEITDKEEKKTCIRWAVASESAKIIRNSLFLAASDVPVLPEEFDKDRHLFNVANGTLNLRTGEFREHCREDMLTKMSPVVYDPKATCPRWEQFLKEIMPDPETISFLQRAIGYVLTGYTNERCFFVFYGPGGHNGKTTFLSAVQFVLGDYAVACDWKSFVTNKHDEFRVRNDIARLNGPRMVWASESEKHVRLAEGLIKQVTGGEDKVVARFLYQEDREFVPQFKLFLATNDKPEIRGTDGGIWGRVRLIPFSVSFSEDKQDKALPDKLKSEGAGILNWALRGLGLYQQDGLKQPKLVEAATSEYRKASDVIQDFIDSRCVLSKGARTTAAALYKAYTEWAVATGEYAVSQRRLAEDLLRHNLKNEHTRTGVVWLGIGLILTNQAPASEPKETESEDLPF